MNTDDVIEHAAHLSGNVQLAMKAARAAGDVIREGYGKLNQVQKKDVGDLVSQVDLDADREACQVLRGESDWPILSEELNSERPDAKDFWIVDPLDGTNAFLLQAGDHYSSVLVAARQGDRTQLGVVYFPLTEEWFYAERGRGAWRNGRRLVIDDSPQTLSDVWVEMNQYGHAKWESSFFGDLRTRLRMAGGAQLVTSSVPNSGVAMRIACGESALAVAVHDNNPDHVKQAPWDIAAPQVILEEAGGVFLNPDGRPSDPFVAEPIIVARSEALAQEILKLATLAGSRT
ncbi:MAG: inositol monophosphatase [Planctomycetota bacterium]